MAPRNGIAGGGKLGSAVGRQFCGTSGNSTDSLSDVNATNNDSRLVGSGFKSGRAVCFCYGFRKLELPFEFVNRFVYWQNWD